MKILILGTPGQLGHELMTASWPAGTELAGEAYPDFDMGRAGDVEAAVERHAPDLVVNATAYTAVDKAESERAAAWAVNAVGVGRLAAACAGRGIPLIHVSTDYVFDGGKDGAYTEDDPVGPVSVYGASKAAGEIAVCAGCAQHVILRTSWVYASHGANFVKTMLRFGAERDEMRVVADQHGAPTAASDLAAAILAIVARIRENPATVPWGIYHCTGAGVTTWHGFAERIFQRLDQKTGRRPRLTAITTADYPTPAARPANSRLDNSRLQAAFGIALPPWEESLDRVLDTLLA
ncbi:dTDP-4-dehydrorhamnose reductase [Azospirillum sp. RWY-5-1]|uniref:dTDP-4-dehydrorhamnose reductase n=1 Tax=Azospirillum oleiclasticum TaxID=2735135 RepID=A0ABX2TL13_9PROT|nr:dTDP-4-dehydrorhamnose reductase [Azospirillum oleiclasticum]NYZ17741.1 dTDP-4-dehydrorhamnose reductase [Azospirillum oleiclasticum]NYZ24988.1 dTDP-4-dehydrorhamnose reductase [Azospirillum oleiclasticum]